jgi:hypothetical protein
VISTVGDALDWDCARRDTAIQRKARLSAVSAAVDGLQNSREPLLLRCQVLASE